MNQPVDAGTIACVEWHDAKVGAMIIRMDDSSAIEFAHLPVYHQVAVEKFHLWSYRASLQLFGLRRFVLEGASGDADYISDVVVFGDDGIVSSGRLPIDEQIAVDRIELIFGSGRSFAFECSRVRLVLNEAIEYVEDWDGPL